MTILTLTQEPIFPDSSISFSESFALVLKSAQALISVEIMHYPEIDDIPVAAINILLTCSYNDNLFASSSIVSSGSRAGSANWGWIRSNTACRLRSEIPPS